MVVHVLDPAAYTLPYDHLLCEQLGRAGLAVHLFTCPYRYGPPPLPTGYLRHDRFYRHAPGRAARLASHLPQLAAYLRQARPDLLHIQWLVVQPLDLLALSLWRRSADRPPLVLTAHDILPREGLPGQASAQRLAYALPEAIVVHSRWGERELRRIGPPKARVVMIRHPVLQPNLAPGETVRLPPELPKPRGPVVLFAGILRPYKGLEVLIAAWRRLTGLARRLEAELWICGHPRLAVEQLQAALPPRARLVARFLAEGELAGLLEAAAVVVLPYRRLDSSGVALLAIGMGKPLVLSDAGSFPELAALGAARCVAAGAVEPLAAAIEELLGDERARAQLAEGARRAAGGPLSPQRFGQAHLELYASLVQGR